MLPILRALALSVPVVALCAADLSTPFTDLRVNIGLATPVKTVDAKEVDPGAPDPAYDQQISGSYRGGPHVGLQMLRGTMGTEGVGWFWGVELAFDLHRGVAEDVDGRPGDFGSDGKLSMQSWTATFMVGPALQANLHDMGLRADAFRVEVGPTLGVGAAETTVGSSGSDLGLLWSLGFQALLTTTLPNDLTITVGGGYEYARAQNRWDNTGVSDVTAAGVVARLGIGHRW